MPLRGLRGQIVQSAVFFHPQARKEDGAEMDPRRPFFAMRAFYMT